VFFHITITSEALFSWEPVGPRCNGHGNSVEGSFGLRGLGKLPRGKTLRRSPTVPSEPLKVRKIGFSDTGQTALDRLDPNTRDIVL
jgi:hypothetical protein